MIARCAIWDCRRRGIERIASVAGVIRIWGSTLSGSNGVIFRWRKRRRWRRAAHQTGRAARPFQTTESQGSVARRHRWRIRLAVSIFAGVIFHDGRKFGFIFASLVSHFARHFTFTFRLRLLINTTDLITPLNRHWIVTIVMPNDREKYIWSYFLYPSIYFSSI